MRIYCRISRIIKLFEQISDEKRAVRDIFLNYWVKKIYPPFRVRDRFEPVKPKFGTPGLG
jgi:hypothetical protein